MDSHWVYIPEGEYALGEKGHAINPHHKKGLKDFAIARYETTNREFLEFVQKTGYKTLAEKRHDALVYRDSLGEFQWYTDTSAFWRFPQGKTNGGIEDKMDHPVTCICFFDALAYCKWKGVRLPTLDEWEVASRAGSESRTFYNGNWDSAKLFANIWHKKNHLAKDNSDPWVFTAPVGKLKPNAWGIYDIYGNVFEFCANAPEKLKSIYPNIASARGGSWWCSRYSCNYINSVDIGKVNKAASFANLGFRVVKNK